MPDPTLTRKQRAHLRELSGLAYSRALAAELDKLDGRFKAWRQGGISAFELEAAIHKFHQGPSRALFSTFVSDPDDERHVIRGLHDGWLTDAEVSPEYTKVWQFVHSGRGKKAPGATPPAAAAVTPPAAKSARRTRKGAK